jgi:predicted DNA-binding protein
VSASAIGGAIAPASYYKQLEISLNIHLIFFIDTRLKNKYLFLKTSYFLDRIIAMTPKKNEIQFTVNLETDVLERLKDMADHAGLSRHKMIVNLLTVGIEEIELFKHVGILQLAIIVRNMTTTPEKEKIRKSDETKPSEMPIPLRIEKDVIDRLGRLADQGEITRQRLARNIIKSGLEELESARKYGLTTVALKVRDIHEVMRDSFKKFLEIGKGALNGGKEVKKDD